VKKCISKLNHSLRKCIVRKESEFPTVNELMEQSFIENA